MTTIRKGMRVRCINDAWADGNTHVKPALGSKWTVRHVWRAGRIVRRIMLGRAYLSFDETGEGEFYATSHFIPIDDLDDLRELVREAKNPDAPAKRRELV